MKYKINRHEKVCQLLLAGKPVTPQEIKFKFKDTDQENLGYRLSTNIYNIKKDGGVIKVHKDGTKVSASQLMNPEQFNENGRFIG